MVIKSYRERLSGFCIALDILGKRFVGKWLPFFLNLQNPFYESEELRNTDGCPWCVRYTFMVDFLPR